MAYLDLQLVRDTFTSNYTLGKLYVEGVFCCYTCEDTDRKLETNPNAKLYAKTAIPRGSYRLHVNYSQHFQRLLPLLDSVPGYTGIRIHGGNTAADTAGCILVGKTRTTNGVANCAVKVQEVSNVIIAGDLAEKEVWIKVS